MTTLLKRVFGRFRAFADGVRDWRIRTLVPVILINVLVFAGLYVLMFHFGESNVIATRQLGARILLDDLELTFSDQMVAHRADVLELGVARMTQTHPLTGITVYNAIGDPVVHGGDHPTAVAIEQAQDLIFKPGARTQWIVSEDRSSLIIGKYLENAPQCLACHSSAYSRLGAIQLAVDLRKSTEEVARRVRRTFAVAGTVWAGLLGLMFWAGGRVIGRPIAEMEKTMNVTIGPAGDAHDLKSLSERIQRTLEVIDKQRHREAEMSRQMLRAEQLAALGELAAGLTHEIKNQLAGVIAALELLCSDAELGSEQRDLYEQMLSELRRVTGTLTSLLRLAKPQPPHRIDVDMARIVREVTMLFSARLRRQGVELAVDISDPMPVLKLDSGLMVQVLVNLLTNSLQATSRGGLVKVIAAPFPMRDGVMLSVIDSGCGITPAQLERIFDPFFTTKDEGTGLGLAICRQIIEQHGGTIAVDSEPGEGTRVTILLPGKGGETAEGLDVIAAG